MRLCARLAVVVAGSLALGCGAAPVSSEEPTRPHPELERQSEPTAPAPKVGNNSMRYTFDDPERGARAKQALPKISKLWAAYAEKHIPVGVSFGLVMNGELILAEGFGKVSLDSKGAPTPDTAYRIGSVTKSFTALALLDLRDRGKLTLDDALAQHIAEANGLLYPSRDSRQITLLDLLQHRSGLPRTVYGHGNLDPSVAELEAALDGFPLAWAPGERFSYSNLGFALLGLTVQRATPKSYYEYIDARLLEPLGMKDSHWKPGAYAKGQLAASYRRKAGKLQLTPLVELGASDASGGLYSTVRDLGRWVSFQLAAYPPGNQSEKQSIRRSTVRECHSHAAPNGLRARARGARVYASASAYAFGWGVFHNCNFDFYVGHGGEVDGYSAEVAFLPDYNVGAVTLSNTAGLNLSGVLNDTLTTLVREAKLGPRKIHRERATFFEPAMDRLLAVYQNWDEAAYSAMLGQGRERMPVIERDELQQYRSRHGDCTGYEVLEVRSPFSARFKLKCERGRLEMGVALSPHDKLIVGFWGTSLGVEPSPPIQRAADALVALIAEWNEEQAQSFDLPRASARRLFARLKRKHGSCSIRRIDRAWKHADVHLGCERGGDLELRLTPQEDSSLPMKLHVVEPSSTCAPP